MAVVTAAAIRHVLADLLGDNVLGTATAVAADSLTDATNLADSTNFWQNAFLKVYSAAANGGQERRVTSSTTAGLLNVVAWTGTPTAPVLYELHRRMSAREYDRHGTNALRTLTRSKMLLQHKSDVTLAYSTDQWEYDIPAGFVAIESVEVQNVTGVPGSDDYEFIPWEAWAIRSDGASTRKLVFQKAFGQYDTGYLFRLRGWQEFTLPVADTDTFNIDPFTVAVRAAQYAALALSAKDPTGRWPQMADRFEKLADQAEASAVLTLTSRRRDVEVA